MDATSYKSLIEKISGKGIVTPYEAIYLQHLNNKYTAEQIPDMQQYPNPFIAVEEVSEILHSYNLKRILSFSSMQEGNEYDGYKWAADHLMHMDSKSSEEGYKGLALLNELRYMQTENVLKIVTHEKELEEGKTLFDFTAYSLMQQRHVKYSEIFEMFVLNFRYMLMTLDIVLTLNYFLAMMVDIKDLKSLSYLHMWLIQDNSEKEEEISLRFPYMCIEQVGEFIITNNHKYYMEYFNQKLNSFGLHLPVGFAERSLQYVLKTIEGETGQKLNNSDNDTPSALAIT